MRYLGWVLWFEILATRDEVCVPSSTGSSEAQTAKPPASKRD